MPSREKVAVEDLAVLPWIQNVQWYNLGKAAVDIINI